MNEDKNEITMENSEPQYLQEKDYKSFFYQMVAEKDSTIKIFNKRDIVIDFDDICRLNDYIVEKLQSHYKDAGFSTKVYVKFDNKKKQQFSSWGAFEEHKWRENESINSIILTWEFNAIMPKFSIPQKHTLTVKLSDNMRPEEYFNLMISGTIEEVEEIEQGFYPVVASVDFIDRILGDELLDIVEKWVNGLRESAIDRNAVLLKLRKHKRKIAFFVNYISYFLIIICSIFALKYYILNYDVKSLGDLSLDHAANIIVACFIVSLVWIFVRKFSGYVGEKVFDALRDYGDCYLFQITPGDKKKQDRMQKAERSNKVKIIFNLVTNLLIDFGCSIIIAYLFE